MDNKKLQDRLNAVHSALIQTLADNNATYEEGIFLFTFMLVEASIDVGMSEEDIKNRFLHIVPRIREMINKAKNKDDKQWLN